MKQGLKQVAPGVWAPAAPGTLADETTLCEWVRLSGDPATYRPRPLGRMAKIGRKLEGALGVSAETVKRLGAAGFVVVTQPSPGVWLLDLDSWVKHLEATDPDEAPDFWARGGENHTRYQFRNALGHVACLTEKEVNHV